MIRDRQHGPVVELNRMQVRRSRARPCATAAAATAHKTVFSQMAAKMALLGAEALLLPHRVWKVKFVGELGMVFVGVCVLAVIRTAIVTCSRCRTVRV